jgi:hypothetical protein
MTKASQCVIIVSIHILKEKSSCEFGIPHHSQ